VRILSKQFLVAILFVLAIAGMSACGGVSTSNQSGAAGFKPFGQYDEGDPDDRPPIIVKNGTISFDALALNGDAGTWVKDGNSWWVKHGLNTRDAKFFNVSLLFGVKTCTDVEGDETDQRFFRNMTSLIIKESDSIDATLEIKRASAGDPFTAYASVSNNTGTVTNSVLSVGNSGQWITEVQIKKMNKLKATCTFNKNIAGLIIFQKTK